MNVKPRALSGVGFTLIELLVVVATIAILAAMLLHALVKAKAQRIQYTPQMEQLGLGFTMFTADHNICFHQRIMPQVIIVTN
jgi:prepilin-type N-terminal cleavage/methylation domain-containing protein